MGDISIWQGGTLKTTKTPTNGQIPIGNSTTGDFTLGGITAGSGISVSNSAGGITISNSSPASGLTAGYAVTITSGVVAVPTVSSVGSSSAGSSSSAPQIPTVNNSSIAPVSIFEINNYSNSQLYIGAPSAGIDGQKCIVRISSGSSPNGTKVTFTGFGSTVNVTPPSGLAVSAGSTLYVGIVYNSSTSKWDVVAVS
jgi:hypothetical protein